MSSISHPTRRAVMVGAGVVLAAGSTSACLPLDSDDQDPGAKDPDRQRVEAMTAQIEELQALLAATVLVHPRLGTQVAALRECHTAHHGVLAGDADPTPTSAPTPSVPSDPASTDPATVPTSAHAAMTRLRTTEQAQVSALAASAAMSQSGALARLFAVLAAGVEQHLAVLSEAGEP